MRTVCFSNSNRAWGGGEAWHLNAALSLAARGWRVLFIAYPGSALWRRVSEYPQITLLPLALGRLSFLNPFVTARLMRFFRDERVDALIMNLPCDLKAAGPAARKAGVRHIVYRRGSALPVRNSFMNRYLFGRVITRLIANSNATRDQVLINNPRLIGEDRITTLPNGVDIEAFDAALDLAARSSCRLREWSGLRPGTTGDSLRGERFADEASAKSADAPVIPGGGAKDIPGITRPFVIGNAGRLNRQKGQHMILLLGRKLLDAGLDIRIIIAGTGEREKELKNLTAALKMEDKVLFCGFLDDLSPFWLAIDLFVLTSLWEGFGNVVIEAGLAQKPVYAFAVSNLPELIADGPGGNGRLFPLPEEENILSPVSRPESADAHEKANEPIASVDNGVPAVNARQVTQQEQAEKSFMGSPGPGGEYESLNSMARGVLDLAAKPETAKAMGREGRRMAMKYSQNACMDALESILV